MLSSVKLEKILKILIFLGLLALVFIVYSQKIEFNSVDLGRHLANGKLVWQDKDVLFKNLYSYTEPNTSFINHHWLGGVIFYLVYLLGGFKLLSFFNLAIAVLIFILTFNFSRRQIGFYLSTLLALPVIFLLSERVEVRPEIFSYLFVILTWLIIDRVTKNKNYRFLLWLIPLFIFWVNIHIYFFIGLALLGFQVVAEFFPLFVITAGPWTQRFKIAWLSAKPWAISLLAVSLACLINPNTWRGLFYPFNIFRAYGYEIAENKSIFYLENLMVNDNFYLFKIFLFLLIISWVAYYLFVKKLRLFDLLLSIFISLLALVASRNLALWALIAWVIISINLQPLIIFLKINLSFLQGEQNNRTKIYSAAVIFFLVVIPVIYFLVIEPRQPNFIRNSFGWGLEVGSADSAKFFKDNNLSGPIFNNYDLGSALIFWLYPTERVFVDNRPEAYSPTFFSEIYKSLQADHLKWEKYLAQYKFKTIYFSHTDSTPWAQQFLTRILADDQWALVYFDNYSVILLNKETNDPELVKKLAINNWSFRNNFRDLASKANSEGKFNLANFAVLAGQLDLAAEIYQGILLKYPGQSQALASFGYLYSSSSDSRELQLSLNYLERALESGLKLPSLYLNIGLVNWRLGEYQKAETAWRSALKLDRKNLTALDYLRQIDLLRRSGKLPWK